MRNPMMFGYVILVLLTPSYLLLEKNLLKVLSAAGIDADDTRIKALIASLTEVNIDEAIKSVPTMMTATATPAQAAPATQSKPAEKGKKEKGEEEKAKEEEALEGLGALFG